MKLTNILCSLVAIFYLPRAVPQTYFESTNDSVNKVILVTLDGVRWQDIFEGPDAVNPHENVQSSKLFPNIYRYFINNGISIGKHSEIKLGNPYHFSLPGYYEILSGRVTECSSNNYPPNYHKTIIDYVENSAIFASWPKIRNVTGPTYKDINSSYRPDMYTIEVARNYLIKNRPEFVWISLGDMDEWAHFGSHKDYLGSLQQADEFLGELIRNYGSEYSIVVTTDHGRDNNWRNHTSDKASERVWFLLAGKNIKSLGNVKLNESVYSYQIAPTILSLIGKYTEAESILNKSYQGNIK